MAPTTDAPDASDETAVSVHEALTYAERDAGALNLDLFVPDAESPPLVVYVHGGGWVAESRDNVPDPVRYAAEWGCALASVDYRLSAGPDGLGEAVGGMADPDDDAPRGSSPTTSST